MANPRELLTHDLQASPSEVPLALSRAGVGGVQKAIRIRYGEHEKLIAAQIDCTVDLPGERKGVHMSRFPELFAEAIEEVVIGEALLIENLAEHIAGHIVERQSALRAESDHGELPARARDARHRAADAGDRLPLRARRRLRAEHAPDRRSRGERDQRLPLRAGARS